MHALDALGVSLRQEIPVAANSQETSHEDSQNADLFS